MKVSVKCIIAFQLLPFFLVAQRTVNKTDISRINKEIETEIIKFKDSLINKVGKMKPVIMDYLVDEYRVKNLFLKKLRIDDSTLGRSIAEIELGENYDKLLNKYYQILLKELKPEDAKKLRLTQRSWMKYRDNEMEMIDVTTRNSHIGRIRINVYHERITQVTFNRLREIIEHLELL